MTTIYPKLLIITLLVSLLCLFTLTRPRRVLSTITTTTTTVDETTTMILEVGLPRSGSSAIHDYFTCQQQRSSLHYCCDHTKKQFPCPQQKTIGQTIHTNALTGKPLFEGCGDESSSRVFTGIAVETSEPFGYFLPQHFALPLLYQQQQPPQDNKAVWILPLRRDVETWATSVLHWHSETQRFLASFGLQPKTRVAPANDQEAARITKGLQAAVERAYHPQTHARKRQQLQTIYETHTRKVREFSQKHSIRLIEINVDDPRAAERILKTEFPSIARPNCWSFDPSTLDDDWKNLTLPF